MRCMLFHRKRCWLAEQCEKSSISKDEFTAWVHSTVILNIDLWKVGWLVGWILWHINLCRLFTAKSIFMKIVPFRIIQFRISTPFKCKYSLTVKNISISSYSVLSSSSNSAYSVLYNYRFCLHTDKCQNSSMLNNFNVKKQFHFK